MLVVYLANRYIRIVEGSLNGTTPVVRFSHTIIDNDGCVVNGVIQDADGLAALLDAAWKEHKLPHNDVRLIIESSQFNSKQIETPIQKPRIMLGYIGREFADVDRIEDPVYGYCYLENEKAKKKKPKKEKPPKDKKQKEDGKGPEVEKKQENAGGKETQNRTIEVFATLAPRAYLNGICSIFKKIGIEVTTIDCARSTVIQMLNRQPFLNGATCILQFVDDMFLINVLEYEGKFAYINRTRLFAEPDTPAYTVEIARSVSNILQFAKAQNMDGQIPTVYVAGLKSEDLDVYVDCISNINSEITVEEWKTSASPEYSLTLSGFFSNSDWISLIAQMRRNPESEARREQAKKTIAPIAILGLIVILAAAGLGINVVTKTKTLNELNAYLEDESKTNQIELYDQTYAELTELNAEIATLDALETRIREYPLVDSETEAILKECANGLAEIKINGYNADSGVLTFESSAPDAEQIYLFVNLLAEQDIFAEVNYTGYTQNSDTSWSVQVNCVLAPRTEAEDES